MVTPPLALALQGPAVAQIRDFLIHVVGVQVLRCCRHPSGVGIYQFGSEIQRDALIFGNPFHIDDLPFHEVSFVKHDRADKISTFQSSWVDYDVRISP